jgi:hypothetical protein
LKNLLLIPIVMLLVAAGCWGVMAAMGLKIHPRDLIVAAVICTIAGEMALAPATLLRSGDAATVSQAGLAGTVIHMFLSLLLAAMAWMGKLVIDRGPFLFLLLAFYWISLIVLVLATARLVRGAAK